MSSFKCVVCKDYLLHNPMQCDCGDRLCGACYESMKRKNEDVFLCPSCNAKNQLSDCFRDKAVEYELRNSTLKCLNPSCPWEGESRFYQEHFNTCKFGVVPCPNSSYGCKEQLVRSKVQEHVLRHTHTLCTHQVRSCDFKDLGCQYKGTIPQLTSHAKECIAYHTQLLKVAHKEMKQLLDSRVALLDGQASAVKSVMTQMRAEMNGKLQPIIDAIAKAKTEIHQLQDGLSEVSLLLQTADGTFIWKIPEVTRRRQEARSGKNVSLYSAPFYTRNKGAGSVSPQFYTSLQGYKSYLRHEKGMFLDPGEVNRHMRGVFATLIHHGVATSSTLALSLTLREIVGLRRGSAPPLDFVFRILSSKSWLMEADEWADLLIICRWANPTTINCKNCGPETEAILTSCNHAVCRSCTLEQFKDKQNSTCPECHEVVTGISFDLSSNSARECVKRKRSEECEDHEVESSPGKRRCLTSLRSTKVCTIEELKNHTGVSNNQLKEMIPEEHLYDLAGLYDEVGMNLYTLQLTPSQRTDVKGLVHDGTHTAMLRALELWRNPNPLTATYRSLLDVVLHMKRGDIALKMCEYIKSKV